MTGLRQRLRSYHRRRIDIPVGAEALVLDVGSGDKPHWRADVLLDRYLGDEFAAQRSGSRSAEVSRPMFDADAADMPFADNAFDYVICSHMLEHVTDPAAVIGELCRVGRAGYIEVPEAASAKIVDFPSHLWWCELRDGVLTFTAKTHPYFDPDIDAYLTVSGMREPLAALLDSDLEHRVVSLSWTGSVRFAVQGEVDPAFAAQAMAAAPHHRGAEAVASRAMAGATRLAYRKRLRSEPILFDDVVKPGLRRSNGEVLDAKVYRMEGGAG